jgi:hypothetical protein
MMFVLTIAIKDQPTPIVLTYKFVGPATKAYDAAVGAAPEVGTESRLQLPTKIQLTDDFGSSIFVWSNLVVGVVLSDFAKMLECSVLKAKLQNGAQAEVEVDRIKNINKRPTIATPPVFGVDLAGGGRGH